MTLAFREIARLPQARSNRTKYAYDGIGNITEAGADTLYYLDAAKPHQVTRRGSTLPVQHDANGNLTYKQTTPTDSITNTYDPLDRLIHGAFAGSGSQQTQGYDYTGRRVYRQENTSAPVLYFSALVEFDGSNLTKYYYAGTRLVAARWISDPDFGMQAQAPPAAPLEIPPELPVAVGSLAILLLLGFGRRERRILVAIGPSRALGASLLILAAAPPIGLFTPSPARADCGPLDLTLYHYHPDHLGSTQVLTDHVGAVYAQIRYTPYGQIRGRWNASGAPIGPSPAGLTREFTGYESDSLTGFEYAGARYYDPELGQFLSHDPQRQFASPYAYSGGDPMNGTDPNGQWWQLALLAVGIAAGLASVAYQAHASVQAGESVSGAILGALMQTGMMVATAAVLGPLGPVGGLSPQLTMGLQLTQVGFGTYGAVRGAEKGDTAGAIFAGINAGIAAWGLAEGLATSGQADPAQSQSQAVARETGGEATPDLTPGEQFQRRYWLQQIREDVTRIFDSGRAPMPEGSWTIESADVSATGVPGDPSAAADINISFGFRDLKIGRITIYPRGATSFDELFTSYGHEIGHFNLTWGEETAEAYGRGLHDVYRGQSYKGPRP